jgi:glutaconate CoA-transferase subunit B
VPSVDFISASGASPPTIHRPGGPSGLVTGRAVFLFDRSAGRFVLQSLHPGRSEEDIRANTGFEFAVAPALSVTPAPEDAMLSRLRGEVRKQIGEIYPQFAATRLGNG